jgi:hypothetical protein
MMYAMVKKVVKPARSSVVNLAPLIALGYTGQLCSLHLVDLRTYMTRSLKVKIPPHNRARHNVIQTGLVRCETHGC